ncbi:MAG: dephospho-CoA kinase [Woeseiaceae bacterium]|nr:dephospho-CoA kinase [Woeseiaceae bacterium]
MSVPPRIGLTGGIASGKTTVANLFADLGATIIDTDVIAREVVEPGQPALGDIVAAFGDEVLRPDGSLDRAALRARIFASDEARKTLEAITHPRIRAETLRQADAAGGAYQVIVVPLLVESPLRGSVDRVLVVDCPEQVQIDRLVARDGESEDGARRILAAQSSRSERLAIADDVITNDGRLEDLQQQVADLHEIYRSLA